MMANNTIYPDKAEMTPEGVGHSWIREQMEIHGVNSKKLCEDLNINHAVISAWLTGYRPMSKAPKAMFFYYFNSLKLCKEKSEELKWNKPKAVKKEKSFEDFFYEFKSALNFTQMEMISSSGYTLHEISLDQYNFLYQKGDFERPLNIPRDSMSMLPQKPIVNISINTNDHSIETLTFNYGIHAV